MYIAVPYHKEIVNNCDILNYRLSFQALGPLLPSTMGLSPILYVYSELILPINFSFS